MCLLNNETGYVCDLCGADVLKEIVNRKSDDEAWQTINSHIRLHHLGTGQALKVRDLYTTPGYGAGSKGKGFIHNTWVRGRLLR